MVLYHVTDGPGLIVKSASPLNSKLLRQRNLHAFDIVAIPEGFQKRVCEPEVQHVLNGPLPKVMVNPEYRFLSKSAYQDSIQLLGCDKVRSKRFFDDDAGAGCTVRFFQLFDHLAEHHWWNCKVEC